jgi:hypothetical protein
MTKRRGHVVVARHWPSRLRRGSCENPELVRCSFRGVALAVGLLCGCGLADNVLAPRIAAREVDAGAHADAAALDGSPDDASPGTGRDAAPGTDGGQDAGTDASMDAAVDAGIDAAPRPTCDDVFGDLPGYELCDESVDSCTFDVDTNQTPCRQICSDRGTVCTGVLANPTQGGCEVVDTDPPHDCDTNQATEICICSRP